MTTRPSMLRTPAFTLLLGVLACSAVAQGDTPFDKEHFKDRDGLQSALDAIKKGNEHFQFGGTHFPLAIPFYEQAYAFNPNNADLNMKLGLCHLNGRHRHLSLPYFKHAAQLSPDFPRVYFLLGYAYQLSGQWDRAIQAFQTHKDRMQGVSDPEPMYNTADKRMTECRNGKSLGANPVEAQMENLGPKVNSLYADYGVLFSPDGRTMYFTSRRANTTGERLNKATNEYFEDVYVSDLGPDGWSEPLPLPGVNTNANDATMALVKGGNTLLIYRDEAGVGDVYQSDLVGNAWGEPHKLGRNVNTKAHESSAFITEDGKWIYFVSDREETGLGGQDIYRSRWSDDLNDWGSPENLGPAVNTVMDEDGVFLDADGTLYFSSRGHNTMGAFDVFRTKEVDGAWTKPVNMGWPINSPDDDLFYFIAGDGTGYLSSVRSGGWGDDDIYRVVVQKTPDLKPEPLITTVADAAPDGDEALIMVKGTIKDLKMLAGMEASIEFMDLEDPSMVYHFNTDGTGAYKAMLPPGIYAMHASAKGFLLHSENIIVVKGINDVDLDISMKPIETGSEAVLRNIFFDVDQATLRSPSLAELGRVLDMMRENPALELEVGGHTDGDGSTAHNQALSEARAQAVVDHLVNNGVDPERLQAKGYGASQPVAPNDTPENKALNRRTSLQVLAH